MSIVRRIEPGERPSRRVEPPPRATRIGDPRPTMTLVSSTASAPVTAPMPVGNYHSTDLATGRGLTYEWELYVAQLISRVHAVELAVAGGGPGGDGASYIHTQSAPAATWTVVHDLDTKPGVTVVSDTGDLLFAEVSYPDDITTVITFGMPYSGTAYLRG